MILPQVPDWLTETVSGPIVFEPDGSCLGGQVVLEDNGKRLMVMAYWLTGQAGIDEGKTKCPGL